MAIFYCNAEMVSRGKGQSVIARAAYEARTSLTDEQSGLIKDYKYKSGLIGEGISLPDNAPEKFFNRQELWNSVARKENDSKRWETATEARRLIIALPAELQNDEKKYVELTKKIAENLASFGMCVDYAVHRPEKNYDDVDRPSNYHAHLLLTTRNIDAQNIHGFGNKNRQWHDREFYHTVIAKNIAEIINNYLPEETKKIESTKYFRKYTEHPKSKHIGVRKTAMMRRLNKAIKKDIPLKDAKLNFEILAKFYNKDELTKIINDAIIKYKGKKLYDYFDYLVKEKTEEKEKMLLETETNVKDKTDVLIESLEKKFSSEELKKIQNQDAGKFYNDRYEYLEYLETLAKQKDKENLFINHCLKNEPYISKQLFEEGIDLQKRNGEKRQGKFDEYYDNDKKKFDALRNLYNEAREKKDFTSWTNFYNELGKSEQNNKYGNVHYQLWEKIRQPYLKESKILFPEVKKSNDIKPPTW